MKTTRSGARAGGIFGWVALRLVSLLLVSLACKDDDPCDPGQVETQAAACSSAAGSTGTAGSAGAAGTSAEEAGDSGATTADDYVVGQPCTDTTGSSDCGGAAPICAPLPSGSACTQVMCLEGEPNAGACPADWLCTEIPGYPSTCLNL